MTFPTISSTRTTKYHIGIYLRTIHSLKDVCITGAKDFAFNMFLATIIVARQFGKDYAVSDVKLLLHNAAMVERILILFGKSPNLMKNNTDFKELLFYSLRAAYNYYNFTELLN